MGANKITIELDRADYHAGDEVRGGLVVELAKSRRVNCVKVTVEGIETAGALLAGDGVPGSPADWLEDAVSIIEHEFVFAEGSEVERGLHRFDFHFTIPHDAPPTHRDKIACVEYTLNGVVDLPWARDLRTETVLTVVADPRSIDTAVHPLALNPTFPEDWPSFTAELQKDCYRVGEVVNGFVRITELAGKKLRKAVISLVWVQHTNVKGVQYDEERTAVSQALRTEQLAEGTAQRFQLVLPEDAPGCYSGRMSAVSWKVKVRLDIAWGWDTRFEEALQVYRFG